MALTTLAACGTDGVLPDLSASSATAIQMTRACKRLTVPAAAPRDQAGGDVYASRLAWKKVADVRAYQLAKTGECIDRTADEYAKGLKR